jgi:HEAT repeat protein
VRIATLGLVLLASGCASAPEGFDSPEPAARLRAISKAAAEKDRSAIPHLIESLDNDDPVVRLAAIRTLEDLTGQTLGYDYAAPTWKRAEQVAAWKDWYDHQSLEFRDSRPSAGEPASNG